MTLNLRSLSVGIENAARSHHEYKRDQMNYVRMAVDAFRNLQISPDKLRELVDSATSQRTRLIRSAGPMFEPVTAIFGPPAKSSNKGRIVGIDGSHVFPEARNGIEYALTNFSIVSCAIGSDGIMSNLTYAPVTNIFLDQDLINENGELIYEDEISLIRSIQERELLAAEMAHQSIEPDNYLIGMLDGTLNIWRPRRNESQSLRKNRARTQAIFEEIELKHHIYLAYLDSPATDQVIQMLRIAAPMSMDGMGHNGIRPKKAFPGLRDRSLFFELLPPGYRSALYRVFGRGPDSPDQELRTCFFYLNVAQSGKPVIARVELLEWVAEMPEVVSTIHQVLLHQCSVVPDLAYPYILMRADEEAWLNTSDRAIIEQLLWTQIGFDEEANARPKTVGKILTRGWRE